MKITFKLIILVSLFLFTSFPVLARNATSSANQAKEVEIEKTLIQSKIEQQATTKSARLTEQRKNIIRKHYRKMIQRFYAALERLEKIAQRIESRIEKMEDEDEQLNLSSIKDNLEELKNNINETENSLIPQAEDKFEEMNNDQNPGEIMPEIREMIKEIKDETIDIHQNLVKIIRNIKSLYKE